MWLLVERLAEMGQEAVLFDAGLDVEHDLVDLH